MIEVEVNSLMGTTYQDVETYRESSNYDKDGI